MLQRWSGPGGYKQVLNIGLPLVASMGSTTVMQFTDRVFLANYSLDAISAALPAGIAFFLFLSFFFGTVTYSGVFIAQYTGAVRHDRVGAALWQGVWFCLLSGLALIGLSFLAGPLFAAGGHPPDVQILEEQYFTILTLGGALAVLDVCLAGFYTGRGQTRVVMSVNMLGALINIPLDYCLINGVGFPELGIRGAALGTVAAWAIMVVIYGFLIFTEKNDRIFAVRRNWRPDRDLFGRLMRYGAPGGLEFALDILAVSFFVFMVGRLGKIELAATNMAFSIHSLAFLPMIGLSVATSTLVGQALGANQPAHARRATGSAMHLTLAYTTLCALLFVLLPQELLALFQTSGAPEGQFQPIMDLGVVLLRYVAAFCLIDACTIIIFGALKGAGDTRFLLIAMLLASSLCMILPVILAVSLNAGIHAVWSIFILYVLALAVALALRYKSGKWESLRIIES
jgi:multidrug resistance protein, MATE family